jgi:hypothetical protein
MLQSKKLEVLFCQLPLFGGIAYPVPAEATKHDKPGCKSLGCPAEIFAVVGATWGASKPGDLNIKNHYANVFTGQRAHGTSPQPDEHAP